MALQTSDLPKIQSTMEIKKINTERQAPANN